MALNYFFLPHATVTVETSGGFCGLMDQSDPSVSTRQRVGIRVGTDIYQFFIRTDICTSIDVAPTRIPKS